jgi:hypothetical protein
LPGIGASAPLYEGEPGAAWAEVIFQQVPETGGSIAAAAAAAKAAHPEKFEQDQLHNEKTANRTVAPVGPQLASHGRQKRDEQAIASP